MGAMGCLQPSADCPCRAGWHRFVYKPVPSEPLTPVASADSPGVGIGLTEEGDTERADDDCSLAGEHVGPENLLDVVDPIEAAGCSHITVPLAAIGRDDDQVKIVLELGAGGVGPDERDLECRPRSCGADPSTGGASVFAGNLDNEG